MAILIRIRNILLAVVTLSLIILIAGIIDIVFINHPVSQLAPKTTSTVIDPYLVLQPTPPTPNAPESAAVESLTPEAAVGSTVSITIKTNATSTCTIVADHLMNGTNLGTKTADPYGVVSWSWQLAARAPIGSQTVTATCAYHGRTAVVQGTYKITS